MGGAANFRSDSRGWQRADHSCFQGKGPVPVMGNVLFHARIFSIIVRNPPEADIPFCSVHPRIDGLSWTVNICNRQRQNQPKLVTQSHGPSFPPRRSSATKDPKTAGLPT